MTVEPESFNFCVDGSETGLRLDVFLHQKMKGEFSRARLQSLIESGAVKVNGYKKKPSFRLLGQEQITIEIPSPEPSSLTPERLDFAILHEDEDILVISKPRGLAVHPGAGIRSGTLVNAVLAHCTDLSGIGGQLRPGIVHRLDRGTSGVMIMAKNDKAHEALSRQFAERTTEKTYHALSSKSPQWQIYHLDAPIRRHPTQRKMMAVIPAGRPAQTDFECLFKSDALSYIIAKPKTGRTHQIRVHLKHLGIPVLGDTVYSGISSRLSAYLKVMLKELNGFYLHAYQLRITHPRSGTAMVFTAPVPLDFMEAFTAAGIGREIKKSLHDRGILFLED